MKIGKAKKLIDICIARHCDSRVISPCSHPGHHCVLIWDFNGSRFPQYDDPSKSALEQH